MVLLGRNENKLIETDKGIFFHKKLAGPQEDKARRIKNLTIWDRIVREERERGNSIPTPPLERVYESDFCAEYQWLEGNSLAVIYSELTDTFKSYVNNERDKTSIDLKRLIAECASIIRQYQSIERCSKYKILSLTPSRGISVAGGLSVSEYANCTGAELQAIGLIQGDHQLVKSLEHLRIRREGRDFVLSHGDMRLDQFLLCSSETRELLFLVDLEELVLAPKEFDIAGLFASILFTELLNAFTESKIDESDNSDLTSIFKHRVTMALRQFEKMQAAFLDRYDDSSLDTTLLRCEMGWAMIERILARAKFSGILSAIDRAILGIARQIILSSGIAAR